MAYDGTRRRIVMFGGGTIAGNSDITWLWDGVTWMQASPANSPLKRQLPAMAFDDLREQVVLFGGVGDSTANIFSDTWIFTASGPPVAPHIITQPVSQTVNAGQNASFTMTATGSSPLSYQWWFNGVTIPGATSATLTLNSVGAGSSGGYSVIVSNPYGSVISARAYLSVLTDGANGTQPAQITPALAPIKPGNVDSLVVVTHGYEPFGIINDVSWVNTMADAIRSRAPANWLVIPYTWEGQAWFTPGFALINARIQGGVYAKALAQQNWQHVHLIGHSAGSAFVEAAARKFKEISPGTVVHSTFLDPYLSFFQVGESVYGERSSSSIRRIPT
jgi:hypothetical protein